MTGYILWLTKDKKVVIDRKLNVIIWFNAILLGLLLVYRSYRDFRWETGKVLVFHPTVARGAVGFKSNG